MTIETPACSCMKAPVVVIAESGGEIGTSSLIPCVSTSRGESLPQRATNIDGTDAIRRAEDDRVDSAALRPSNVLDADRSRKGRRGQSPPAVAELDGGRPRLLADLAGTDRCDAAVAGSHDPSRARVDGERR